jgi:thiamine pyrophosphokinase
MLANIQLLSFLAKRSCHPYLYGKHMSHTAIADSAIAFPGNLKGCISVFAMSEIALGVGIKGLKYTLHGATLNPDTPIGVSNEFSGEASSISVEKGCLLVCMPTCCLEEMFCGSLMRT